MKTETKKHVHAWQVDTPEGYKSVSARCACGDTREFRASITDEEFMKEGWNQMHANRSKAIRHETNLRPPADVIFDGLGGLFRS